MFLPAAPLVPPAMRVRVFSQSRHERPQPDGLQCRAATTGLPYARFAYATV